MEIKCKPYSDITVETGHIIKSNGQGTVKKINFTFIPLYLEQELNVNSTVRFQWKVGQM